MSAIEVATRNQRDSLLWHLLRKDCITSSNVGEIVKARNIKSLAKWQTRRDLSYIPAVQYGIENEPRAKEDYTEETGIPVQDCGLFISKEHSFIGATPDGIIVRNGIPGCLEIKCPYSIRFVDPNLYLRNLRFIGRNGKLLQTHNYYYQIQMQLYTTGYTFCDFVVWSEKGIYIEKIDRNEAFIKKTVKKLVDIYAMHHPAKYHFTCDEQYKSPKYRTLDELLTSYKQLKAECNLSNLIIFENDSPIEVPRVETILKHL